MDQDLEARILVVDDEEEIRDSLKLLLESEGLRVDAVADGESCVDRVRSDHYDLVLLDLMLPKRSGSEIQAELSRIEPGLPVIIITAMAVIETAVSAIRAGAYDYVTKPWNNEKLLVTIKNAIEQRRLHSENVQLRRALKERFSDTSIVGKSEGILALLDLIAQVAASRSTVLIQGESGTGKELVAKAIHLKSPRSDKPFVPVHSGSMPVDLLESTLFGHVKGAFTSAISAKKGLFEVAHHGTIFFDEIGTIGAETQAKLLRVMQEREFMRLGGTETVKVDVRIIAATNVDLKSLVDEGGFREDLFYRLNVIRLDVPPLRRRREDIPPLVDSFLRKYCEENGKRLLAFSSDALKALMDCPWPGNVRELENVVERAVVLADTEVIGLDLLPESVTEPPRRVTSATIPALDGEGSLSETVEAFEKKLIVDGLRQNGWSQTATAEFFRIPLSTLNQKIKRYKIDSKKQRRSSTAYADG